MRIDIIIISALVVIAVAVVWWLYRKTDWKAVDENNKQYYTEEGDHIYYDRRIIEQKTKEKENINR